jgi:hypothetical protein
MVTRLSIDGRVVLTGSSGLLKAPSRILALLGMLFVSALFARGASTLNFPKLAFESDTFVGIAIVNPTGQEATVTLTAYDTAGRLVAGTGFVNPVVVTIKANQQIAKLTSEVFGSGLPGATVGWVQATSATDNLTGFFLLLNGTVTFMDGADLPVSAKGLTFQQVRIGGGYSTEIDLVNPSATAATVQVQLFRSGGTTVTKTLTIPARGMSRSDTAALFGLTDVSTASYLDVQSDVEVAGVEFVKGPGGEILALNGRQTSEQLARLVFPQLAVLGDYKTELGVLNHGSSAAIVTITAYKPSGVLYDTAELKTNPVTRTLSPSASLREDLETMFGFRGSTTLDGWVEVKGTEATLSGYLTYGIPASGAAAAVTTEPQGRTRALFSHIATSGYFTGVAALNPGTLAANVRIVAEKATGEILGSYDTVLQPGERIAKLLGTSELIPEAANQSEGVIWVKSDVPVYLASIFGSNSVLANIPPQAAPETYAPDVALQKLKLTPPLAVLRPGQTQQFRTDGATVTGWKVNGVTGGQASTGTITTGGLFTAPSVIPPKQVVTISAEASKQEAGGSVDIVDKSLVAGNLRAVQSVAYLNGLAKLYVAEFAATGALMERVDAVEAGDSEVSEVSATGTKRSVRTFNGVKIAKLLPYRGRDGREYLLASAQTTGRILRIDPTAGQFSTVATDLNEPTALVLDPVSGNLLVAEKDRITTVFPWMLDGGLTPAAPEPSDAGGRVAAPIAASAAGLAVDRCGSKIYYTVATDGLLEEYDKSSGKTRTVLSGLRNPGALLGLYRAGVSCPDGFELLLSEKGLDRTILVIPKDGSFVEWAGAKGVNDLALLPEDNPLTSRAGVVLGETSVTVGSISIVAVANLYDSKPPNPPPPPPSNPNDADLAISVTWTSPITVGTTQTETVTVTNKGPATATNVAWNGTEYYGTGGNFEGTGTRTIPPGGTCRGAAACSLSLLLPNTSAVFKFSATVTKVNQPGILTFIFRVQSDQNDPDSSNNTASVQITVAASAADAGAAARTTPAAPSPAASTKAP